MPINTDFSMLVTQFHHKIGGRVSERPTILPADVVMLRQRLICEELGETAVGMHEQNLEKVADGLCDLLYVVIGTGVSAGCPVAASEFMTNEAKRREVAAHQITVAIKTITYWVARVFDDFYNWGLLSAHVTALAIAVYEVGCSTYGFPMEELFVEVHRANMMKTEMDKFAKGGKAEGWRPPSLLPIIDKAWSKG